jgi:hypothetical protein
MQKGSNLRFCCQSCQKSVKINLFDLERDRLLNCENCEKQYCFSDDLLIRQIKKFEALCLQIKESEEILSNTAVGIDIGERHIKIPYKLLLTRLSSTLDLMIGDTPFTIMFRIEPIKDCVQSLS